MKRKQFCQLSPTAYRLAVARCCAVRRIRDGVSGIPFASRRQEELLPQVVYRHKSLIRRRLGNVDMICRRIRQSIWPWLRLWCLTC